MRAILVKDTSCFGNCIRETPEKKHKWLKSKHWNTAPRHQREDPISTVVIVHHYICPSGLIKRKHSIWMHRKWQFREKSFSNAPCPPATAHPICQYLSSYIFLRKSSQQKTRNAKQRSSGRSVIVKISAQIQFLWRNVFLSRPLSPALQPTLSVISGLGRRRAGFTDRVIRCKHRRKHIYVFAYMHIYM